MVQSSSFKIWSRKWFIFNDVKTYMLKLRTRSIRTMLKIYIYVYPNFKFV